MARILTPITTKPSVNRLRQIRPRTQIIWLLLAILLTTVLTVLFVMLSQPRPKKTAAVEPILTVTLHTVAMEPFTAKLSLTGSIAAIDPLSIGAQVSGLQITSVPVEEGDYVRKGQVLAVLDSSVLATQLQAAQARLAAAQAAVPKAIQPNRPEEIAALAQAYNQAQADASQRAALVTQAEATLLNARHTAIRYRTLYSQGAVSQQDMENQVIAERTAAAALAAAQANLRSAQLAAQQSAERSSLGKTGGRREDITIARAQAAENAAAVRQLQTQIVQTIVKSPDDGLITHRDAHIGDISSQSKPLFEMVRQGKLEMRAQITQQDLAKIAPGSKATITSGPYHTDAFIWQISPTVDPATRLGIARLNIPTNAGLKPGMFAQASLTAAPLLAILVPERALSSDGLSTHVFVYAAGIVHKRDVITGIQADGKTQIISGLQPGEKIVVVGAGFLSEGDRVRVAN